MAIEWNYGHTASLFKCVDHTNKLKLLASRKVHKVYTVATILRMFTVLYMDVRVHITLADLHNFVEHYLNQIAY